MGTRSAIAIKLPSNVIMAVYCHYDGYLSYNGKVLSENYNDRALIMELLSHGGMSALKEKYHECDFYNTIDDGPKLFNTVQEFTSYYEGSGCEYYYLYDFGWTVSQDGETFDPVSEKLKLLETV
jgi:hypothetical protein